MTNAAPEISAIALMAEPPSISGPGTGMANAATAVPNVNRSNPTAFLIASSLVMMNVLWAAAIWIPTRVQASN
jgi:hypothetical protein